ncbi:MAG: YHS domain-containing protein [Fimbriimonadia bacterium]|jgi:YHS domain-containing protein
MVRMKVTLKVALGGMLVALVASSFAQTLKRAPSMEECTACKYMISCNQGCEKRNIATDEAMLKTGFAMFFFGHSEADSKWVITEMKSFEKAVSSPDAQFCDFCMPIAKFAMSPNTRSELVPTKNGAVYYMTSTDKAAVAEVHKTMKKMQEMMGGEKDGHDHGDTAPGKPVAFIGKGDGVKTCPVLGYPVSKNVSVQHNGKTVYFCCAGCIAKFKENPAAYLKN